MTLSSTGPGEGPAGDLDLPGYVDLLEHVKTEVRTARVRAARAVNIELVQAYWRVGKLILTRQQEQGWGTKVIDRLARDLRTEFPQMRGWSPRNLRYMRTMAAAWPDPIGQHPVAQLPWGHVTVLLDKIDEQPVRDWYVTQTLRHGWSRTTLVHHIATGRHARVGQALDNFTATLPESHTDLVREIIHDPYDLDFLAIDPGYSERQLEDALITRLTAFLTELGQGFAFVGRQYRLPIGERTPHGGGEAAGLGAGEEGCWDALPGHEVAFPVVGLLGPAVVGEDAEDLTGGVGVAAGDVEPVLDGLLGLCPGAVPGFLPGPARQGSVNRSPATSRIKPSRADREIPALPQIFVRRPRNPVMTRDDAGARSAPATSGTITGPGRPRASGHRRGRLVTWPLSLTPPTVTTTR